MAKIDSTIATIAVAFVAAAAVSAMLTWQPNTRTAGGNVIETASTTPAAAQSTVGIVSPKQEWATSATGRIEPKNGLLNIAAPTAGEITEVLVASHDRVQAGDLLVRTDDSDQLARVAAAEAETEVRRRERDDESKVTGIALDRRKLADASEVADRELFFARQTLDERLANQKPGSDTTDLVNLRQAVSDKEKAVANARAELATINRKPDMPLPDRLESALTQARSDLRLAYQALERTRIRAPSAGTILRVDAKVGELTGPASPVPLVTFGDLSEIKVRAEVEERNLSKIRLGQRVVVRSDAFPDKDFKGHVTAIAAAIGAPNIATRGPRRPSDVDVLDVTATLEDSAELVTGMRVDVFFAHPETAAAK